MKQSTKSKKYNLQNPERGARADGRLRADKGEEELPELKANELYGALLEFHQRQ